MHMQNAESLISTRSQNSQGNLYQRIVLEMLGRMDRGSLHLTLPDGSTMRIGDAAATHGARIHIVNPEFFKKCVLYGDIGFGESYVDGDWETDDITAVISWMLLNVEQLPGLSGSKAQAMGLNVLRVVNRLAHRLRDNSLTGSRKNIEEHYDLSNDFFATFLDRSMTYSSAYFRTDDLSLEQAQREKYDRLCQQLKIGPSDHVLEIGSGWGGFAIHAASTYGCKVTTVTISEQQYVLATHRIREAGLADRVQVLLQDYRLIQGRFDKVVSIEMLEAVGHRYYEDYFRTIDRVLARNGLVGLQVITSPDARYEQMRKGVDWIQKHVFPGSLLPSIARLNQAVNKTSDLFLHDLKDLGRDYARTLKTWRHGFHQELQKVRSLGFDERFIRKWNYYLSYCEAAFALRNISVVQMVYTRPNNFTLS